MGSHNSILQVKCNSFTDEAWFHLSGYIDAWNNTYWNSSFLRQTFEVPLHNKKTGMWCDITAVWIGTIILNRLLIQSGIQSQIIQLSKEDWVYVCVGVCVNVFLHHNNACCSCSSWIYLKFRVNVKFTLSAWGKVPSLSLQRRVLLTKLIRVWINSNDESTLTK